MHLPHGSLRCHQARQFRADLRGPLANAFRGSPVKKNTAEIEQFGDTPGDRDGLQ